MKKVLFSLVLLTLYCHSLAGAKRPDWVNSRPVATHLFQGIGVADNTGSMEKDRLRADQNARTEIIQEISSSISSNVSSYYSETNTSGDLATSQSMEVFSTLSTAYAEATIEGIAIVDRYFDKKTGTHYSYATLRRSDFQAQMARQAEEARQYAQERYGYAQQALADKNIGGAINHLSQALGHVMVAQSVVKRHLEGDLEGSGGTSFLDAGLSHALSTLMAGITITKVSGDGQKGERNQGLPQNLEGRVTYASNGEQIPLPNIALAISVDGAEADYEPLINTNDKGVFQGRIQVIHSASIADPAVHFDLHLPNLQVWLEQSGGSGGEQFPRGPVYHFQMDVIASVRVFVRVLEEINGEPVKRSNSESMLVKALVGKKYKVIDARQTASAITPDQLDSFVSYEAFDSLVEALKQVADYAVVGVISSETSSTGTLNYARANATVNTIDLNSGRIIATGVQENVKAAGNTEEKANTTALRKCSTDAIAELLAQMDTALN